VGWLSDRLTAQFGAAGLRYALCGIAIFIGWAALHYYLAGRAMGRDLSRRNAPAHPSGPVPELHPG